MVIIYGFFISHHHKETFIQRATNHWALRKKTLDRGFPENDAMRNGSCLLYPSIAYIKDAMWHLEVETLIQSGCFHPEFGPFFWQRRSPIFIYIKVIYPIYTLLLFSNIYNLTIPNLTMVSFMVLFQKTSNKPVQSKGPSAGSLRTTAARVGSSNAWGRP